MGVGGNTGLKENICLVFRLYESSFLLSKSHHPVHSEDCLYTCKCLSYIVYKESFLFQDLHDTSRK